ncbi:MAG: DUF2723 domain-containing protein [Phycisphaerales bacterium]|nr:DUF2723 domain-containing protein [Phycisphaerales bacterium]
MSERLLTQTAPPPVQPISNKRWQRPAGVDRLAIPLTILLIAAIGLPRLPRGACFDDAGELQLACATWGVAHPPGYAAYISIGHIATLIPGVEPAFAITLLCFGSGLIALALGGLLMVRLGLNAWVAAATMLILFATPPFWTNLLSPEVYMPSLALMAGAVLALLRFARLGVARDLLIAALCFGLLVSARPNAILFGPFVAIVAWPAMRANLPVRRMRASLSMMAVFLLPTVYSVVQVVARDTPATTYNYIAQYNTEFHTLPEATDVAARLRRAVWLMSAAQYRSNLDVDPRGGLKRIAEAVPTWPFEGVPRWTLLVAGLFGLAWIARRSRDAGILLLGVGFSNLVFVSIYEPAAGGMARDALDRLPLFFAGYVCVGSSLSFLAPTNTKRSRRIAAGGLLVAAVLWTMRDMPNRPRVAADVDASHWLAWAALNELPQNARIYATWRTAAPLWYATRVQGVRPDIEVMNAAPSNWMRIENERATAAMIGRVFLTEPIDPPTGWSLSEHGALWRLAPSSRPDSPDGGDLHPE